MVLNLTEASSLAIIDRQIAEIQANISAAQYEVVRRVIYQTADLEYQSLLKFSEGALAKGASALTAALPIVVDVPEIQVSIVPYLQRTFLNPVYCCTTSASDLQANESKAANGLRLLAPKYPNGIFAIGQDRDAMNEMVSLLQDKTIEPSLVIATPPIFEESTAKQKLQNSYIPNISINSSKGGANIAEAIFNSLIRLVWQAEKKNY